MNIYEIASEYKMYFDAIYQKEELDENDVNFLSLLESEIENKAVAIAAFVKNLEAEQNAILDAINKMQKKHDKLSKKSTKLKEFLKQSLQQTNIKKITKSPFFNITIAKNPPKINVFDEQKINENYFSTITLKKLNKIELLNDLKTGKQIDGVLLTQDDRLVIK